MPEEHANHFKGNFVKAEVFLLVDRDVITIKSAWCLLLIDNMCHVYDNKCCPTNEWLGERLQVKPRRASMIIQELKQLKLLESKLMNKRRWLRVRWEMAAKILKKIDKNQGSKKLLGSSGTSGTHASKKLLGSSLLPKVQISNIKLHSLEEGDNAQKDGWTELASQLSTAISKTRKVNKTSSISNWADDIRKLHTVDGVEIERIEDAMEWYCKRLVTGNMKFIPVIHSGSAFRSKFLPLEDAIEREEPATKRKAPELTTTQEKMSDSMAKELEDLDLDDIDIDELTISVWAWREKMLKDSKSSKPVYKKTVLSNTTLFTGYAMWIRSEVQRWEGWSGKTEIFHPGEKHFLRYLKQYLKRENLHQFERYV